MSKRGCWPNPNVRRVELLRAAASGSKLFQPFAEHSIERHLILASLGIPRKKGASGFPYHSAFRREYCVNDRTGNLKWRKSSLGTPRSR